MKISKNPNSKIKGALAKMLPIAFYNVALIISVGVIFLLFWLLFHIYV